MENDSIERCILCDEPVEDPKKADCCSKRKETLMPELWTYKDDVDLLELEL